MCFGNKVDPNGADAVAARTSANGVTTLNRVRAPVSSVRVGPFTVRARDPSAARGIAPGIANRNLHGYLHTVGNRQAVPDGRIQLTGLGDATTALRQQLLTNISRAGTALFAPVPQDRVTLGA